MECSTVPELAPSRSPLPRHLRAHDAMPHLVLLGDSIFDNGVYVPGEPDVLAQVEERLPDGWKATLLAVDGSVVSDVDRQVDRLPDDATHLVLSVGGNDALGYISLLELPAESVAEVLDQFGRITADFRDRYCELVTRLVATGLPLTVCTIYEGNFPDPVLQRRGAAALTFFNDAIVRTALRHRLPVIDLRAICSDRDDYANPIEPSSRGGAKIADAIVAASR